MFQTPGGRTPENAFICWITVSGLANKPYIDNAAVSPGKTDSKVYIASPPATSVTLSFPSLLKTRHVISHQPRAGISSGCFAVRPRLEAGALESRVNSDLPRMEARTGELTSFYLKPMADR